MTYSRPFMQMITIVLCLAGPIAFGGAARAEEAEATRPPQNAEELSRAVATHLGAWLGEENAPETAGELPDGVTYDPAGSEDNNARAIETLAAQFIRTWMQQQDIDLGIDNTAPGFSHYAGMKAAQKLGYENRWERFTDGMDEMLEDRLSGEAKPKYENHAARLPFEAVLWHIEKNHGENAVKRFFVNCDQYLSGTEHEINPSDTAWLWSQAAGKEVDLFDFFRDAGYDVAKEKIELPYYVYEQQRTEPTGKRIHALIDVSHVFSFWLDWTTLVGDSYFPRSNQLTTSNHQTVKAIDFGPFNFFLMPMGSRDIAYLDGDAENVREFMAEEGGGVWMYHMSGGTENANKMAEKFGFTFVPESQAVGPFEYVENDLTAGLDEPLTGKGTVIELDNPDDWTVLAHDAEGRVVLATRDIGKGRLVVSTNVLSGRPGIENGMKGEAPNLEIFQRLAYAAATKDVPEITREDLPVKLWGEQIFTNPICEIHSSEYVAEEAEGIANLFGEIYPHMEEWLGIPFAGGDQRQEGERLVIHLIPCGSAGWGAPTHMGLAVWWGGWPEKRDSMIGLLGHEMNHIWVTPMQEPLGNEDIAIFSGYRMMGEMGYEDVYKKHLETIENKYKSHPELKTRGDTLKIRYQVALKHFEETYGEEVTAKYFRLKRKYVRNWDTTFNKSDSAWLWSKATGEDQFPYLRSLGYDVNRKYVTLDKQETAAK